jgi:hypothetical protein
MTLAEYLAQAQFAKKKYARVTMVIDVDTGRSGETNYAFRILAPKSITNVVATNDNYALTLLNGNPLNPSVTASVIDVAMKLPEQGAQSCGVSFDLVLDGKPLVASNGQSYIFAVRQDGPRTARNPYYDPDNSGNTYASNEDDQYYGPRPDLHPGNEFDDAGANIAPDEDVWLRSAITGIDINLVDPGASDMSTREIYNQGSFAGD